MPEEDEDLEKKVEKLKKAIDEAAEAEPWDYIREEASKAPAGYLKVYKGGKEIKPEKVEEEFNKRAETYLNGLGIKAKHGKEFYGHMIRTWLKGLGRQGLDMITQIEDAIKQGDETTALYMMQKAYETNVTQAKDQSVLNEIKNQPYKIRIKMYDDLAQKIGGKDADPTKVIQDLEGSYSIFKQYKKREKEYRKAA